MKRQTHQHQDESAKQFEKEHPAQVSEGNRNARKIICGNVVPRKIPFSFVKDKDKDKGKEWKEITAILP